MRACRAPPVLQNSASDSVAPQAPRSTAGWNQIDFAMMTFRNQRLRQHTLPMSTAWLLNDVAEAKGKQELFTRPSPQMLKALREAAIIQSAESSQGARVLTPK